MKREKNNSIPLGSYQSHMGKMTDYVRDGKIITRGKYQTSGTDTKSLPRIYQRLRVNNLNAFCKVVQPYLDQLVENRESGKYYYHYFLQYNKEARPYGLVVNHRTHVGGALIANYWVTQGSLPSIVVDTESEGPEHGITNIMVGDIEISNETKVSELARAIVEKNKGQFRYGDKLIFFQMTQTMEGDKPRAACRKVMLILAQSGTETMEGLNLTGFGVRNGCLAIRGTATIGGYTWIHVRTQKGGALQVSSQRLTPVNRALLSHYGSVEKMREAAIALGAEIPKEVDSALIRAHQEAYEAFGITYSATSSGHS